MNQTLIDRHRSNFTPSNRKPRHLLGKALATAALSARDRSSIEAVVAARYRGDDAVLRGAAMLMKSAVAVADSTTPGWASELVPTVTAEFQAAMLPVSAFMQLRALGRAFTLTKGRTAVPARAPRTGPSGAAWVGETGSIPVLESAISAGSLGFHKLAGIVAFSNELDDASNGQCERIFTEIVVEDLSELLDATLADAAAANDRRPAGLLFGIVPTASIDRQTDIAAIVSGLIAMKARTPAILIHPARRAGLWGDPTWGPGLTQGKIGPAAVVSSYWLPEATVIGVDAAAIATGMDLPLIDASGAAVLVRANADDTAPTMSVDAAGAINVPGEVGPDLGINANGTPAGAGTAGAVATDLFQTFGTALRVIQPASWSPVKTGAVVAVTRAAW